MSASVYTVGYGSILSYATLTAGVAGSYTAIAQTVDLTGPDPEVGDINVTNNDSPANTKEHAPGMIEPGTMDFELIYKKAVTTTLYGMFGDGNVYGFKETYPDGSTWVFQGYLSKFGMETKTEDQAIKNKITIKLTNKPAFTAGT